MAYGITSDSQLINMVAINAGCDQIDEGADLYTKCSKKINNAATALDKKALSVEGKSMQPALEDLADQIKKLKINIASFTDQIRSEVNNIYSAQKAELNNYLESQKNK